MASSDNNPTDDIYIDNLVAVANDADFFQNVDAYPCTEIQTSESIDAGADDQLEEKRVVVLWTHKAILQLIDLYHKHRDKFYLPDCRMKDVWNLISREMTEKGYIFRGSDCSDKFRSMKYRYKKINADYIKCGGELRSNWKYYFHMDELMGGGKAANGVSKIVASPSIVAPGHHRGVRPVMIVKRVEIKATTPPSDSSEAPNHNYQKQTENKIIIIKSTDPNKQMSGSIDCIEDLAPAETTSPNHNYHKPTENKIIIIKSTDPNKQMSGSIDCIEDQAPAETTYPSLQVPESVDCGEDQTPAKTTCMWNHASVIALIELFTKHQSKFSMGHYLYKDVWEIIARNMREKGMHFDGIDCDKKFRNLKYRYNKIKSDHQKFGGKRRYWQYFDTMDEVLARSTGTKVKTPQKTITISSTSSNTVRPDSSMQLSGSVDCDEDEAPARILCMWNHESVIALIELFAIHRSKISMEGYMYKDVWEIVSHDMRERGLHFDGTDCDKKWRNLKYRYNKIKADHQKFGGRRRYWQYFDSMDEVLARSTGSKAKTPHKNFTVIPSSTSSNTARPGTWNHASVVALIEKFTKHRSKFSKGRYMYKDVWKVIARDMRENGMNFAGIDCDKKFRNLKYRYNKIKTDRQKSGGERRRYWQYFEAMDKLLGGTKAKTQQKTITVIPSSTSSTSKAKPAVVVIKSPSSVATTTSTSASFRPVTPPSTSDTAGDESCDSPPQKRRRHSNSSPPEWFAAYLSSFNERMDNIIDNQSKMLELSREKNAILARLVDKLKT